MRPAALMLAALLLATACDDAGNASPEDTASDTSAPDVADGGNDAPDTQPDAAPDTAADTSAPDFEAQRPPAGQAYGDHCPEVAGGWQFWPECSDQSECEDGTICAVEPPGAVSPFQGTCEDGGTFCSRCQPTPIEAWCWCPAAGGCGPDLHCSAYAYEAIGGELTDGGRACLPCGEPGAPCCGGEGGTCGTGLECDDTARCVTPAP